MRVLIGTDGSRDAIAAATHALTLLAPPDTVTIVAVVDAPAEVSAGHESGFAGGMATDEEVHAAWIDVEEVAVGALQRTAEGLTSTATIEQETRRGDAGPVLCQLAEELSADVVVVGSRGRGAIRRALLGSVSTYVSNNAPCAVLIVRSGTHL
jgi:nucleotide-binding universal stress UspA family protein